MTMRLLPLLVLAAGLSGSGALAQDGAPVFSLPIACEPGRTCAVQSYMDNDAGPGAKDYRCGSRSYDAHKGVDIRILNYPAMRAGVAVLAAAPGKVRVIRDGMEDLSIRDRVGGTGNQDCGNVAIIDHANGWATQYCHMRKGSVRVKAGDVVKAGDPIGLVGLTGNTEFPHLHFMAWRGNTVIDPFAYGAAAGACSGGRSLWSPAAAAKLEYRPREVLGAGFASAALDMAGVDAGNITAPTRNTALVAYVRALGLKAGDTPLLSLRGPDGAAMADTLPSPLPRDQAQRLTFVRRTRVPPGGWPPGVYRAHYTVRREGRIVLERQFELKL